MEESENQLVDNLDDSGEDDVIMVSSSELEKDAQADDSENGEEIEIEDDESAKEEDDTSNDAKDQSEDNVAAESEVVETVVDKKTPNKAAQKKTKKKDKGKLLVAQYKQIQTHGESNAMICIWTIQRPKKSSLSFCV